jgi:hypothetical protein
MTESEETAAADEVPDADVTHRTGYDDPPVAMPTDGPFGVEGQDEEVAAAQEAAAAQNAATQEALTGDNPPGAGGSVAGAEAAAEEEPTAEE